jgi:hypothetical protein
MSNLFKKVRIVHSPLEFRYEVQQKNVIAFSWQTTDCFRYFEDKPSTSPFGAHDSIDEAFEKAKRRAETLLAKSVVWEQTNYFWY